MLADLLTQSRQLALRLLLGSRIGEVATAELDLSSALERECERSALSALLPLA